MGSFLVAVIGFFLLANYVSLVHHDNSISFGKLLALNFALYAILFLYDTLVVDALVLGLWRPGFLKLSDELGRESMGKHIVKSIPVGIAAGIVLSLLVTAISYLMLM